MSRMQAFLTFFVAPAIAFAIVAYSYLSGSSAPFLIAVIVLFGSAGIAGLWAMLTSKSRREARDQEREEEFLRKELQKDENKE